MHTLALGENQGYVGFPPWRREDYLLKLHGEPARRDWREDAPESQGRTIL